MEKGYEQEVLDRLSKLEREVSERLTKIEAKIDGYGTLKAKVYENERAIALLRERQEACRDDISSLRESQKWIIRAVAGAVIAALIGIFFAFAERGMGI